MKCDESVLKEKKSNVSSFISPFDVDKKRKLVQDHKPDIRLCRDKVIATHKKDPLFQKDYSLSRKPSIVQIPVNNPINKGPLESMIKSMKTMIQQKRTESKGLNGTPFNPGVTFQNIDFSKASEASPQLIRDLDSETSITLIRTCEEEIQLDYKSMGSEFVLVEQAIPSEQQIDPPDCEALHTPSPTYLTKFTSKSSIITLSMRAVLLNWVAEVTELFMFKREVFHSAINYLDRYLDAKDLCVSKKDFQLLGMTCLYLASKFDVGLFDGRSRNTSILKTFLTWLRIYTRRVKCSHSNLRSSR